MPPELTHEMEPVLGKLLSAPNHNPSAMTGGSWESPDPGWERESKPQDSTFLMTGEGRVDISLSLPSLSDPVTEPLCSKQAHTSPHGRTYSQFHMEKNGVLLTDI